MADNDATTKPPLETSLERINAVAMELKEFRSEVNTRLDRIDGMVHKTRGAMLDMRADLSGFRKEFNEFRDRFKEPA